MTNVRKAKTIGNKTANGEFYIVKVKVSSNAKAATLGLTTVDTHVVDARGQTYYRDKEAELALAPQPDFEQRISPVESFEKEIVFDLPEATENPRLNIREAHGIDRVIEAVLVDDEDSVFHRRAYFKLEDREQTAFLK